MNTTNHLKSECPHIHLLFVHFKGLVSKRVSTSLLNYNSHNWHVWQGNKKSTRESSHCIYDWRYTMSSLWEREDDEGEESCLGVVQSQAE